MILFELNIDSPRWMNVLQGDTSSHATLASFEHPWSLDDNQHNNTSCVSTKHVWTGQGFCSLKEIPNHGPSLMEVDWGAKIEFKHTCGYKLSEVDWGAHYSSLFLYQKKIDHDGEVQNFFTSGLWGGLPQGNFTTSGLWGGPSEGNIFQPQVFRSIIW